MDLRLPLQQAINFRELGGYPTTDGGHIATHKLLRSARLAVLSQADVHYLADYGVRYVVDFRSTDEMTVAPDRLPTAADYHALPILAEDATHASDDPQERARRLKEDPGYGIESMLAVYRQMIVDPFSQQAYRRFFELLLENDQPNESLVFHCTAGKDRTGLGAYFILHALGVPEATIVNDYLATNNYIQDVIAQEVKRAEATLKNPEAVANWKALESVDRNYLQTAEQAIAELAGNVDGYLRNILHVTPQEQADLRRLYVKP